VKSQVRYIHTSGNGLHTLRLENVQNRIVVSSRGSTRVSEGSVVLSVNGVSALLTAGHTMLKLMNDIPPALPVELAIFKQPIVTFKRKQLIYQINILLEYHIIS
jgi:hypothetical protein